MALITNYTTLQTAIADYLNNSTLTSFLPNFTQNCESKLYKSLRIRAMEEALNISISNGVATIPSDFMAIRYAYIDGTPVQFLKPATAEEIYSKYPVRSGGEKPLLIGTEADNFIFGPFSGSYTLKGIYYEILPSLSASNLTNWFTANAPDLLLYGSLLEAESFIRDDPRIPLWHEAYNESFKIVQHMERHERHSGAALQTRLG